MSADDLRALHDQAADIIVAAAKERFDSCGGDFGCPDCPGGNARCRTEHAAMCEVVVKLRSAA